MQWAQKVAGKGIPLHLWEWDDGKKGESSTLLWEKGKQGKKEKSRCSRGEKRSVIMSKNSKGIPFLHREKTEGEGNSLSPLGKNRREGNSLCCIYTLSSNSSWRFCTSVNIKAILYIRQNLLSLSCGTSVLKFWWNLGLFYHHCHVARCSL